MSRVFSSLFSRLFPWIVLAHAALFMLFWLTNRLFYASTNDYLADMLGTRLDFVSLLLWISAFILLWSASRLVLVWLKRTHKLAAVATWIYTIVSLVYIAFFYGSFQLLFKESPVQFVRLGQILGYFRLFVDAAMLLAAALVGARLVRQHLRREDQPGGAVKWSRLVPLLVVIAVLWSLPLFLPPTSVYQGELQAKPLIMAHRGASMLVPENTLAAANAAVKLGVYGLETDVHLSRDGQLFLVHDDTFDRTTDVSSVFPGREQEPVESFTLAEISQLNAGAWFAQQDPYGSVRRGLIASAQQVEYERQVVPLLDDWLNIARENNLAFRFDLKQPPQGHPYAASFFERALAQVHQAGIDAQVWFIVDDEQLPLLKSTAPGMLPTYGANYKSMRPADEIAALGYRIVNVEYGISPAWIEQYQAAGLWVDVYTVDEPWQFSRLWLLGVDSVTTSNAGVMAALDRPVLALPYGLYALLWSLVGLLSLGLVFMRLRPQVFAHPAVDSAS